MQILVCKPPNQDRSGPPASPACQCKARAGRSQPRYFGIRIAFSAFHLVRQKPKKPVKSCLPRRWKPSYSGPSCLTKNMFDQSKRTVPAPRPLPTLYQTPDSPNSFHIPQNLLAFLPIRSLLKLPTRSKKLTGALGTSFTFSLFPIVKHQKNSLLPLLKPFDRQQMTNDIHTISLAEPAEPGRRPGRRCRTCFAFFY